MEVLQGLLMELAVVGAVAVLTYVIQTLRAYIKSKASKEDLELLEKLADIAVWAVEQKGTGIFSTKKDAAREIILTELNNLKAGKFPTGTVDAAIEAAVATNFHYSKHTRETEEGTNS